ncbi:peptidoglycan DD-metalloendopeptidase family protein [Falsiruegeria mediterranea]
MPISTIAREFRHPLGNGVLTPSNDGDGYYVAFGFDEANPDLGGSFHLGADWNGEGGGDTDIGEPVYAIGNAIVVDVVSDQGSSTSGFGNYVVLRHELPEPTQINGQLVTHVHSLYAHLDNVETLSVGQSIGIGQKIGELGKSGNAAFAHLHFEITLGDTVPTQDDGYNPAGAPSDWVDPIAFVENWVPPPFVHIRDLAGNGLRSFLDDFSVQTGAAVAATVQAEYAGLSGMTVEDSNDLPLIGNWFGRSLDVSDTLANIGAVTRLSDQLHRLAALDADVEAALAEQSQAEATAFATGIDTLLSDLNASLGDLNNSLLDDYIDLFETTFSFTFGIGGAIFDNYVSNPLKSVFTVIEVGVSITETAVTFGLQGPEEYFDQHPEQLAAIDLAIQFATKSMAAISSINVTSLLKPNIRPEELIDLFKEISNNFSEFLDLLTSSGVAQTFGYNLSTAVEARDALNGGNLLLHHQKFKEILGPLKLNIAGEVAAINLHAESNPQIYGGVLDQVASYASVLASAIDAYFAWTEIGALSEAREQAGSSYERDALEVMTELKIYEFSKSVVNAIESLPFLTETPLINEIKTIFEAGLEVVEGAEYEKLDELDDLYRESLPLFSAAVDQGASLFATALASLPSEWGRDQAVRYVMADDELKYDGLHYDDDVLGNDLENVISGGAGADDIRPSSGADTVYAQGGQDVVYAGDGNDFVYGGEDNDYLKGEGDNDQLFGEGGDDTVSGDGGLDSLYGGDGDDTLNGGDHGDLLKGEADADFLHGEGGNDTLYGDAGADFLSGGSGADSLIGGSGADTFVYGMDALPNGLQSVLLDEIRDYNQGNSGSFDAHEGDKIDISAIVGAAYASGAGEQIEALWKLQRSPYNNKLQLLVDADGSGNTYSWTPLLFLDGVSSGADIEVIVEPGATTGPAGLPVASDPGSYTIAPSSRTVTEDDITIQFTLTRPDDSLAETVYVSTTQDRGSSNNGDYDFWLNVPVTFAAGDDTETVTIRINEDNSDEALETFGLIVQSSPDQPASQYLASGSFTIIDDDAGGGSASFTEFDDDEWITPSGGNEAFDALAGDDLVTLDLRGWSSVNSSHSSGVYTFRGDGDEVSIQNAETLFVITGSGDDSILTGSGTDGILSGSGNDYINAGAGRDVISAGAGDDTITGIGANEIIAGGEGVDLVTFYASSETSDLILNLGTGQGLGGSWTGVERVSGTFGSGDDTVVAGAQVQNLNGGSGVDFLTLDYTGQLYNGETATRVSLQLQSSNTDLVYFGTTFFGFRLDGFERFDITATAGDDYIYTHTGAYNDTIRGGAGNDTIHANGGNDVIEGGAGDDHITGGDGADVLNGGSGDDRFYGVNSGDVIVGGSGVDEVTFDLSSDTTGASFDLAAGLGANGSWTGIERITGTFGSGDDTVVAGRRYRTLMVVRAWIS